MLLQELLDITESKAVKKKKSIKDKTADKYDTYVAGNMLFRNTCPGSLSGTKKISKDLRR